MNVFYYIWIRRQKLHEVHTKMAATLKFAVALLTFFSVKKPSLLGSNSICYSFECEEITDMAETFISSSLWQYKQEYGINLRA